jgi:PilZ domain
MKTHNLRAEARIAVSQRAELNSGDAWFACRVFDMSDTGFFLVCNKALAVGQILDLRCELYPAKFPNVRLRSGAPTKRESARGSWKSTGKASVSASYSCRIIIRTFRTSQDSQLKRGA